MSEMIDRVANALALWNTPNFGLDRRTPEEQEPFMARARLAIEAMREPTQAMEDAADAQMQERPWSVYWEAMIDAALGEKP